MGGWDSSSVSPHRFQSLHHCHTLSLSVSFSLPLPPPITRATWGPKPRESSSYPHLSEFQMPHEKGNHHLFPHTGSAFIIMVGFGYEAVFIFCCVLAVEGCLGAGCAPLTMPAPWTGSASCSYLLSFSLLLHSPPGSLPCMQGVYLCLCV